MMKTTSVLLLIGIVVSLNSFCQESEVITYELNSNDIDLSKVEESSIKSNALGNEVARYMVLFKDKYTYIEAASPTSPVEKTAIHKPTIYNSITKIERTLKKEVKKGLKSEEEAKKEMIMCLKVVLSCANLNTIRLEEQLKEAKKADAMIGVYKAVVLE